MPVRPLPPDPNLDHLKYQAKDLLRAHAARDMGAAQRLREFHPRFAKATDAEILDAKLKRHIEKPTLTDQLNPPHHERIEDAAFRRAVELLDAGDAAGLRAHLKRHPNLVRQHVVFEGGNYFQSPTLLEFTAENPVRHGRLPKNIVQIAGVILDAGAEQPALNETLELVASGRVPRECGVQIPLVELLCARGADPNTAMRTAAMHGEFAAVDALMRRGGRMDLPVAAALGRMDEVRRLLPTASHEDRHLALALGSQYGRVEVVRLLLDAGEDPNRYNPVGGHSHSTPLHQAALAGHEELVRLLVERGARADLKDIVWQGTPADWARHGDRKEVEAYLRGLERRRA